MICDTGAIYALYDADDAHHVPVREAWDSESGPFVLPMTLLSEVDYLLHTRLGIDAALDFVESVESGAFVLQPLLADDVTRCRELMNDYRDLVLGLADASIVAIAERLNLHRVLTVDLRHFRTVRPKHVSHFLLVPADSRA
ncbi:MAG: PIN domain-containing protein [Planctomycetales bacterium]